MGATIQGMGTVRAPRFEPRVRENVFQRTLWAIERLIPESGDVGDCAAGRFTVAEIAGACGLSRNAVRCSLAFLRTWRVLWLRYEGLGVFEVRFQRRLVKGFVLAAARVPSELPGSWPGIVASGNCWCRSCVGIPLIRGSRYKRALVDSGFVSCFTLASFTGGGWSPRGVPVLSAPKGGDR